MQRGMLPRRRNLREWRQNKTALMQRRMRKRQRRVVENQISIQQKIEIDDARALRGRR